MNFFNFLIFDLISFIIHIFILLFAYRFLTKHKCNLFSKIAEKQIEDFWDTYDSNNEDDSMDKFVESINILNKDDSPSTTNNNEQPKFF